MLSYGCRMIYIYVVSPSLCLTVLHVLVWKCAAHSPARLHLIKPPTMGNQKGDNVSYSSHFPFPLLFVVPPSLVNCILQAAIGSWYGSFFCRDFWFAVCQNFEVCFHLVGTTCHHFCCFHLKLCCIWAGTTAPLVLCSSSTTFCYTKLRLCLLKPHSVSKVIELSQLHDWCCVHYSSAAAASFFYLATAITFCCLHYLLLLRH